MEEGERGRQSCVVAIRALLSVSDFKMLSGMVELVQEAEEVVKATFQIVQADVMEAVFSCEEGQQYYLAAAMSQLRKGTAELDSLCQLYYEMVQTPVDDVSVYVNTSVEFADCVAMSVIG